MKTHYLEVEKPKRGRKPKKPKLDQRTIAKIGNLLYHIEDVKAVNFGEGEFRPDFQIGEDIFIEHWCYNEKTPQIPQIDKKTYLKHRNWKEAQKEVKALADGLEELEKLVN